MRAVIVGGTHSGCGKTTLALGLMAAFKSMGLKVQPFKCGPDFIDAGLHRLITGVSSRNLDIWMCGEDYVRECFYKHSERADISVVEGVMGMYDGKYSTASIAKLLNIPIILVVDAYGMAESAGAIVRGFVEYWKDNTPPIPPHNKGWTTGGVIGVIFNRVASENHFNRLNKDVHDVPVLGYLPRDLDFEIPSRHLGLMVAEEHPMGNEKLNKLAETIRKYIDTEAIISGCNVKEPHITKAPTDIQSLEMANCQPKFKRIAVAYDKAFCFYYEDNLDMLRKTCAEIVKFSPLEDSSPPDGIDAIYLGGGYPEIYAEKLSNNRSMLKAIYDWSQAGMPIYAECGGLMYLSRGIYNKDNRFFKMCGVFPFETSIRLNRRSFLGYRETVLKEDCILGYKGSVLRGHEFHYSEIVKGQAEGTFPDLRIERSGVPAGGASSESGLSPSARGGIINKIYSVKDNNGESREDEGYSFKNTLASYIHLHFGSNPRIADNFINFIRRI